MVTRYGLMYEIEANSPNEALTIAYLAINDSEWGDRIRAVRLQPYEPEDDDEDSPSGSIPHFGS